MTKPPHPAPTTAGRPTGSPPPPPSAQPEPSRTERRDANRLRAPVCDRTALYSGHRGHGGLAGAGH